MDRLCRSAGAHSEFRLFRWWAVWLLLCASITSVAGQSCEATYARIGQNGTASDSQCGSTTRPCSTVSQAIDNAGAECVEVHVHLVASAYNATIPCEKFESLENVTIDGSQAGHIPLGRAGCSSPGNFDNASWLEFWNSSNIALQNLNLDLTSFAADSAILLRLSAIITVTNLTSSYPRINTSTIIAHDSAALKLRNCEFYGPQIPNPYSSLINLPQYRLTPVLFNRTCLFGCEATNSSRSEGRLCCSLPEGSKLPNAPLRYGYDILMQDCMFRDIGIPPEYRVYTSTYRFQDATAAHFGLIAADSFAAFIEGCTFSNLSSPYDTVLKMYLGAQVSNSKLLVKDSAFQFGSGYIGGAMYVRVAPGTINSTLDIQNTTFLNNTAVVDGGAVAVSYGFQQSLGAGAGVHTISIDGCNFTNNRAGGLSSQATGGAIAAVSPDTFVFISGLAATFPTIKVTDSVFVGNSAPYAAGIFLSGIQVSIYNTMFQGHLQDSAVVASSSALMLGHNTTFLNNSASLGGAVSLYQFSLLQIAENSTIYFIGNFASYGGGAIFADESSSTPDIADLLQFESNVGLTKPCFLQAPAGSIYSFNSSISGSPSDSGNSSIIFRFNTSPNGNSIFANSFTTCINEGSPFLDRTGDTAGSLQYNPDAHISSGPVWLIFHSSSSDCLKRNPNNLTSFWWFHRGCNRTGLLAEVYNNSLFLNTSYRDQLRNFTTALYNDLMDSVDVSGYAVLASPQTFTVPWAVSNFQWFYPRSLNDPSADDSRISPTILANTYTSDIILYPAPGELFLLQIDMADVYFDSTSGAVQMQVHSNNALLMYNGEVLALNDVVLFIPGYPIRIGLAGRPGDQGILQFSSAGQLAGTHLHLLIPFRFRPCHRGFTETPLMRGTEQELAAYLKSYVRSSISADSSANSSQLQCQCPTVDGVKYCANGSDVIMDWRFWAGGDKGSLPLNVPEPLDYVEDLQSFEADEKAKRLLTSVCYGGYCTDHNQADWNVREEAPCIKTRTGLICGSCADGYALNLAWNPVCDRCTSYSKLIGELSFFFLFLQTGISLLLFAYFDVGRSAVFDSWVSFDQFCLFIARRELVFWTLSSTGSAGYQACISDDLNVMEMTAILYLASVIYVFWVVLVFQLSRFVAFRRFFLNNRLIVGIWAVVLFTYSYLLLPSFGLLGCHEFDGRVVMFYNASFTCFGRSHLPWGLLALFALIFVAIPMPILLIMKRSSPRVKPVVDVYLSYVKDDKHWYMAYSMLRRIVVCILSVYIVDSTTRQLSLAFAMQCYLFLHFVMQPFRREIENKCEAFFLGSACFFAILNLLPVSSSKVLTILLRVTYLFPVIVVYIFGIITRWRDVLTLFEYILTVLLLPFVFLYRIIKGQPFQRISFLKRDKKLDEASTPLLSGESSVQRAKELYDLRDDLLVDVFDDDGSDLSSRQ